MCHIVDLAKSGKVRNASNISCPLNQSCVSTKWFYVEKGLTKIEGELKKYVFTIKQMSLVCVCLVLCEWRHRSGKVELMISGSSITRRGAMGGICTPSPIELNNRAFKTRMWNCTPKAKFLVTPLILWANRKITFFLEWQNLYQITYCRVTLIVIILFLNWSIKVGLTNHSAIFFPAISVIGLTPVPPSFCRRWEKVITDFICGRNIDP